MSPRSFHTILALACAFVALSASSAAKAQIEEEHRYVGSPERVGLELRIGTFRPTLDDSRRDAFRSFFGGDHGPLLAGEIDIWAWRIPYVGPIGVGIGLGWARYKGHTCADQEGVCVPTDESARFTVYPLQALAVLRIDVLARELHVPIILTPKIGLGYSRFNSRAGGSTVARGGSMGLHWGAQIALELDGFEPRAARALDEQWGINHSYLFFELYGSQINSALNLGTDIGWVAGLGLQL